MMAGDLSPCLLDGCYGDPSLPASATHQRNHGSWIRELWAWKEANYAGLNVSYEVIGNQGGSGNDPNLIKNWPFGMIHTPHPILYWLPHYISTYLPEANGQPTQLRCRIFWRPIIPRQEKCFGLTSMVALSAMWVQNKIRLKHMLVFWELPFAFIRTIIRNSLGLAEETIHITIFIHSDLFRPFQEISQ